MTRRDGHVVGDLIRAAQGRHLKVYLQIQAAIPPGYRVQFGGPTDDDRPRLAIEQARAWSRSEISMTQARQAAYAAHAAARAATGAAREAARAAGHAAATGQAAIAAEQPG